ncbi:hypothetical protein ACIRD3_15675 [Kitasatospora sp. NPDC093550]|uniref:hypothetical protein n=1 Tax=Kitasatospora sp. NPDC093550 TaxID=3364089 RepID=UPI00380DB8C7
MNPQDQLDAYVQRNAAGLSRLRALAEDALADAMVAARLDRPKPGKVAGDVVSIGVRDKLFLAASRDKLIEQSSLRVRQVRGRGLRVVDAANVEVSLRKVPELPRMARGFESAAVLHGADPQELLFDMPPIWPSLDELSPVILWSIGADDVLAEFTVMMVDDVKELERAKAYAMVPIAPAVRAADEEELKADTRVSDDFEDFVGKKMPAEGTGDKGIEA